MCERIAGVPRERSRPYDRWACAALVAIAVLAAPGRGTASAATPEQQLADRYAPIVMLKKQSAPCDSDAEQFVPAPVTIVLGNPAVKLVRGPAHGETGFTTIADGPTTAQVAGLGGDYYLDLPGDPLHAGCTYEKASRELMHGRKPTTYAHIVSEPGVAGLALQYWFFWYFNQFNDVHEGDWEMVQLAWDGTSSVDAALARAPDRIALAQHGGGELAAWDSSKLERQGDHPVVYPASGSHANYYGAALYLGTGQNGAGFGCDNSLGPSNQIAVDTVVVPDGSATTGQFAWLSYEGKWGQYEPALNNGPDGPAQHGQWREPFRWMAGLRSSSPVVPLGSTFGPSVTGAFCGVIAAGSIVYNKLSRHPKLILLLIGGLIFVGVFLARRTIWSPAPFVPLEQSRRTGQIIAAAARAYRVRGRELLALGAVFVPLGIATAALQQLIFANDFVSSLIASSDSRITSAAIAVITGSFGVALAYNGVVALVSVAVSEQLADSAPHPQNAYRTVARRLWPLLVTQALVTAALLALSLTIVGIPVALKKAVDWAFTPWQVVVEGRSGREALRRSTALVRGQWPFTARLTVVLVGATLTLGPIVGFALIFLTDMPLALINVAGSIVYALVVPYTALAVSLLLLELCRRRDVVGLRTAGLS